jgi:hypothetical protein
MSEETEKEVLEEKADLMGMEPNPASGLITSFAELDAAKEAEEIVLNMKQLTAEFIKMSGSIFLSVEIEDKAAALESLAAEFVDRVEAASTKEKWQPLTDAVANKLAEKQGRPMKTEGGVRYPASDYAFTPDKTKPSTWKLRLSQGRPGNITRSQLGAAAAALSPGGFRGRRVQIPSSAMASVKRRIRSEYSKLDVAREDMPDSVKELGFFLWKEADDSYRWLARYSNNYRDEDSPPEIIAAKSHERFVEMVDKEEVELPELWLWHVPQWRWGQAQVVAYDDAGFAIAAGTVDDTKEARDMAETIMALPQDSFLVSHGMPVDKIVRDEDDPSIIIQHVTKEISPLPAWAAANKLTGFTIIHKEASMAIPDEKRDRLQETGVSAALLDALEAANTGTKEEAEEIGIESKEAGEEETPQPEETPQAEPVPVSRDELAQVFNKIGETFQALTEQVGELATEVKALKETRAVEEELSLEDLFTRAAGHSDARVDGRTKEGKSRPKETPPEGSEIPVIMPGSKNPVMAHTIDQLLDGGWLEGVREHTTGGH